MLNKDKVLQVIGNLPEKFSIEDLVERLIILEKIEKGLAQVQEGKILTQDEAKKVLALKADPKMQRRVEELIEREKTSGLSTEEKDELDRYIEFERLVRLAKASEKQL